MEKFEFPRELVSPDDVKIQQQFRVMRDYYRVKYDICKEQNPSTIAEIGVRAGYSAWSFLQAVPTAKYIGLDANNNEYGGQGGSKYDWWGWAKKILADYDVSLLELDTQAVDKLPKILPDGSVDFFHVDGDHSAAGVQHDLDLALGALAPGGLMLVDDIDYIPAVARGVKNWLDALAMEVTSEYMKSLRGEMLIRRK